MGSKVQNIITGDLRQVLKLIMDNRPVNVNRRLVL